MNREIMFLALLFIFSNLLVAFMDDTLKIDHDIVNVRKSSASELAKDFEITYKVVRFTIKNYYPETRRFNLSVTGNFSNGDPMADSCPDVVGKYCLGNGSIVINYPSRTFIDAYSFDDLIMDIGVREDAVPARYNLQIVVDDGESVYASQYFTLNVGEDNFVYGVKTTEEGNNKLAMSYIIFFAFLMAMLVFGMLLLSKGRG